LDSDNILKRLELLLKNLLNIHYQDTRVSQLVKKVDIYSLQSNIQIMVW